MICLLLDTSCPTGVVALAQDSKILSSRYLTETKKHSEFLSQAVDEVLAEANLKMDDISLVCVGKGPGSFIGVRIAMAYAKGICLALNVPLVGVGTLIAFAHDPASPKGKGLALLDARRAEYYVQKFEILEDGLVVPFESPFLYSTGKMAELSIGYDFAVGSALEVLDLPIPVINLSGGVSAEGLLGALQAKQVETPHCKDETQTLVPEYVRDPDAKPMPTMAVTG